MGLGDNLMASGMARGANKSGYKVAFGDGKTILWDQYGEQIFRNNPNVLRPRKDITSGVRIKWVPFYKGHRTYNHLHEDRWYWNMEFKAEKGEVFLDGNEIAQGKRHGSGFILIEPNLPLWKEFPINKNWGFHNYQTIVNKLRRRGHKVLQFNTGQMLDNVVPVKSANFRDALSVLSNAALYIGPEGGLHHGAAAMGVPAVVLFGGFIPPAVTGYDTHINLTGSDYFCGSMHECAHCREAMRSISTDLVMESVLIMLGGFHAT